MCLTRVPCLLSRLFLSRGADVNLKNQEGETPLECCSPGSLVWLALQTNRRLKEAGSSAGHLQERLLSRLSGCQSQAGPAFRPCCCILDGVMPPPNAVLAAVILKIIN